MSTASRGAARERQVRKLWEERGWVVVRSAASASPVDLWAMRRGSQPYALQIKANKGSPWMHFRKVEREELCEIAAKAGATPLMIHWPPNGSERAFLPHEWPQSAMVTER